MAFTKITESDLTNKGVIGLQNKPGLSTSAMQEKLEQTAREVIIPKFNELSEELDEKFEGYVSVTADGIKTTQQLLDELFALIDSDKMTARSVLFDDQSCYHTLQLSPSRYVFSNSTVYQSSLSVSSIWMVASSSVWHNMYTSNAQMTFRDLSNLIPASGKVYKISY